MTRKDFPQDAPKLDIRNVEVTLEQTKVYRNGLQQARLRIDLESTHDGNASDLTDSEIESIELFDYHNTESGTIPIADDMPVTYRGWSTQREYLGYVSLTGTTVKPRAPRQSYFLYVSAHADALETVDIAFRITGDDKSIWRTNGRVTRNGVEQYVAAMDMKVGITMTPVPPVRYPATAFLLGRRPLLDPGQSKERNEVAIFADIVTVSIQLADQTTLGIRRMTCVPAGLIHWKSKLPGNTNPCFTGYVQPGQTAIHWNEAMEGHFGETPPPTNIETPETDLGVIVLCGRIGIPSWTGAPEDPVRLTMTDAHGSAQTCSISFVKGERDELIVT